MLPKLAQGGLDEGNSSRGAWARLRGFSGVSSSDGQGSSRLLVLDGSNVSTVLAHEPDASVRQTVGAL